MSYISILIPGIQCPSKNILQAKSYFSDTLNIDQSDFTITELENSKRPEFYVKFKNSNLNLISIQKLLEERDILNEKILFLENELKIKSENTSKAFIEDESKSIILSNRIKNLLSIHMENSESFKISTERTLERIKEEFEFLVSEFEEIKKIDSHRHSITNRKEKENKNSSLTSRSKNATTNINIIFNSFKHNEETLTRTNLSNKTSQEPMIPKLNLDQYNKN